MDMIQWYILGMILLITIVVGFYIFDKSKISTKKKYLVYGIIGLPCVLFFGYINWTLWVDEGVAHSLYWLCFVVGLIACIVGIYLGLKREDN